MNGLTAKRLRQLAHKIVLVQGENPSEGFNSYNQETNMKSVEPAYADGHQHDFNEPKNNDLHERRKDPDGVPLIGVFLRPGTIHHAHKVTVLYRHLKKLWKSTGGKHEIFGPKFRKNYNSYAQAAGQG